MPVQLRDIEFDDITADCAIGFLIVGYQVVFMHVHCHPESCIDLISVVFAVVGSEQTEHTEKTNICPLLTILAKRVQASRHTFLEINTPSVISIHPMSYLKGCSPASPVDIMLPAEKDCAFLTSN